MKLFLSGMILLFSAFVASSQTDPFEVTSIEFVTTVPTLPDTVAGPPVMHVALDIDNMSEIGKVTIDVLMLPDNSLVYKKEYTRTELTAGNLWTETGLLLKVEGLEAGLPYEVRTTFQNLQMAFLGQLINHYPL